MTSSPETIEITTPRADAYNIRPEYSADLIGSCNEAQVRDRIVAIIPRGEVLRNFVYTGVFSRLGEHVDLTLLSVGLSRSTEQILRRQFPDVRPLEYEPEPWVTRIQREFLDVAHNRWLWTKAAQERSRLRDTEAVTSRQKLFRLTKKAICYPLSNRVGLKLLSSSERVSSKVFRSSDKYIDWMRKLSPSLVFNGSHVHSSVAIQAVQAAQWLGIPTATFIFSWDNLTSQGRILLPYDYFLVWNDSLKQQLLDMYRWVRPDNVIVTGTPQFDSHFQAELQISRAEFCREYGLDPERPIVLYSTGMPNHMPGEQEIVEEIADMLDDLGTPSKPQLLVRVYPKDLTGRFGDLKQRRPDIRFPTIAWDKEWLTPRPEDSRALANTLRHSDVGINVASTVSLELCMFDKPVINVGYNPRSVPASELKYSDYYDFDHYKPVVDSGAVRLARDRVEMRRLLESALTNPSADSRNRSEFTERMFGDTLDGNSARRVADALLKISTSYGIRRHGQA